MTQRSDTPDSPKGNAAVEPGPSSPGAARFVVASSAKVLLAQAAVLVLSLAFTVYLARSLSKPDFATIVVFAILSGLVKVSTTLGLDSTVVQQVPGDLKAGLVEKAHGLMKTTFFSRLGAVGLVSVLLWLTAPAVATWLLDDSAYGRIVRSMLPCLALLAIADGLKMMAQAVRKFGVTSASDLTLNVTTVAGSLSLYFAVGLEGYYLGAALGPLAACGILLTSLRRYVLLSTTPPAPWGPAVRYSLPFYAKGYLRYALLEADRLIVGLLLPSAALADYGVARKFTDYLRFYGSSLTTPAMIKLGELRLSGRSAVSRGYALVSRYAVALVAPACLLTALFSPELTEAFGGSKYRQAWPLLAILAIAQLLYSTSQAYGASVVFVMAKPAIVLLQEGVPGVLNVAASAVLVSALGSSGMAWSQAIAYGVSVGLALYLVRPFVRVRPDWSAWTIPVAMCLPAALLTPWVRVGTTNLSTMVAVGFVSLLLGLSSVAMVLRETDWMLIDAVLPSWARPALGYLRGGTRRMRRTLGSLARPS